MRTTRGLRTRSVINGNARIEFKDNAINLTFSIFSQLRVFFLRYLFVISREKSTYKWIVREDEISISLSWNMRKSCTQLSSTESSKWSKTSRTQHRCAIANWNARGKIKYDSYSIFKRGSCKTNNATYENFYHVQISTKYFVNNHLRQSARDFRLHAISVVNQKDVVVVVEDKFKANFIWDKKQKEDKSVCNNFKQIKPNFCFKCITWRTSLITRKSVKRLDLSLASFLWLLCPSSILYR